jgi:mono/diheme cytochrome c family protein
MSMQKITLLLVLVSGLLYGVEGEKVFDAKCMSCHKKEQKRLTKDLVAPTLPMVVTRLKKQLLNDEEEFVDFVVDYIVEPKQEKMLCANKVMLMFGLMPPIGKTLTPQEREAVAKWMFTRHPLKKR